ncbi:MAG: ABC transporter substrate-binding protein [Actinomycetota bacterium]
MNKTQRSALAVASLTLVAACGHSGSTSSSAAKDSSTPAGTPAASGSAAVTGSGSAAVGEPTKLKIMVGGIDKQIYLPNKLAEALGFFKEQNLDVTLIDEASGQSSEQQVLSGGVQAGSGSYHHTIELQAAGKFMESVVQLQTAPGEALMVSTKSADTVKSATDLKGANMGVTELGSGTQTLSTAILGKVGIGADKVHFLPVGAGSTFLAAMQQGRIAAGMTTEPTISKVISTGAGKILVDLRTPESTKAALGGEYPFISVFMNTDYVNSHKDVVQRMVNAYVHTLNWMSTHSAAEIADKVPADYYAGDKAAYITALTGQKNSFTTDGLMPESGAKTVASIEAQYVPSMKGKTVDLSKTYTNEFATAANAAG